MEKWKSQEQMAVETLETLSSILAELKEIRGALVRIDSKTPCQGPPIWTYPPGWQGTEVTTPLPEPPTITC